MSLLKKTFVLSGQPPKGYLTVLKIGTTGGIKLNLASVSREMTLAVKLGAGNLLIFPIRALKEEFSFPAEFDEKTQIQAVLFLDNTVFAHTGNAPAILFRDLPKEEIYEIVEEKVSEVPPHGNQKSNNSNNSPRKEAPKTELPKSENASAVGKPGETTASEVVGDATVDFKFFGKQTDANFYDRVRGRMDEMLTIYPREESLERLIPDSRWVKVPYSEDEFYIVGILSDGTRITHIGYGVKGVRSVFPPKEAEELSEFLSTSGEDGYWLMFQDAGTGAMLPID